MLTISRALRMTNPTGHMSLSAAFVGSGGKTSAMFQTAREMAPALVTTSTHLFEDQARLADQHFFWPANPRGTCSPIPPMENTHKFSIEEQLHSGITLVTGNLDPVSRRFRSLDAFQLEELRKIALRHSIPLLIEADGSRTRPLKAPGSHEPAIPDFVDLVVVVAGLSGLHHALDENKVHRPEIFSVLSGLREGELISPEALGRVLSHPQGGLKNIPSTARKVVLLNQADTDELQSLGNRLGEALKPIFDAVIISKLQPAPGHAISVKEKVAAVILAAGASSRFGQPKQLLDFHSTGHMGKPFIRVVAETAIQAGLTPVVVVSGSRTEQVAACLEQLPVQVVYDQDWQSGQSSSIKVGLAHLPQNVGGAIFLLADQPQVSVELLRALVERHSQDLPPILAPYVFDERANPLLFDQVTFSALQTIPQGTYSGDIVGRAIFSKFSPRYLNWYDRRLLLDVDTLEDQGKYP